MSVWFFIIICLSGFFCPKILVIFFSPPLGWPPGPAVDTRKSNKDPRNPKVPPRGSRTVARSGVHRTVAFSPPSVYSEYSPSAAMLGYADAGNLLACCAACRGGQKDPPTPEVSQPWQSTSRWSSERNRSVPLRSTAWSAAFANSESSEEGPGNRAPRPARDEVPTLSVSSAAGARS